MVGKREPTQFGFLNPPPPESGSRIDRLLQRIDQLIDFEPVREMVVGYFATCGRPSIDPVLMVKVMFVGYLLGITSDRELVEECADRISVRRFLGLGLSESLPAHSSFTHWRQRLGADFFRVLLGRIVGQCQSHGMALSGDRTVDGTMVKAQANRHGPVVQVPEGWDVDEYLQQLGAHDPEAEDDPPEEPGDDPPPASGGKATPVNTHDPDARLSRRSFREPARFSYFVSFCADAHNGLITDATAYAREWASTTAEHVLHDIGTVTRLAADGLYDDGKALVNLFWQRVNAFVPLTTHKRNGQLSRDEFRYDHARDLYICPEGHQLHRKRYKASSGQTFYVARASDCGACPLKAQCTKASRRTVTRQDNEWAREQAVRAGPDYELLQRRRRVNEHLNLMAKRDHGMSRARGLGLDAMRIQASMTAAAINVRKLVAFVDRGGRGASRAPLCASASLPVRLWAHLSATLTRLTGRRLSTLANVRSSIMAVPYDTASPGGAF